MADIPLIHLALYAQTDVGMVRSGNEDNFLILDLSTGRSWTATEEEPPELLTYQQGYYGSLLAVSDGMGGALAGEVASRLAVETVRDRMLQLQAHGIYNQFPFHERLRLAIEEANFLIHTDSLSNPAHKGLGATFTGVAAQGGRVYFGQVGDSRAYLIRQGRIARITKDQSLVQQLIDAGQITEEEAETHSYRNVILQALGAHNNVNVEVNSFALCNLDTLVLCSDGLSGKMHGDEIATLVNGASDFKTGCQQLIALANSRGGEDNITVVIVQFSGAGLPQPSDPVEPLGIARSPDTPLELNWSEGATTDPLPGLMSTSPPSPKAASSPLPPTPPPTNPLPSSARARTQPLHRASSLTGRVEPITAVFELSDFEDDPPFPPPSSAGHKSAELPLDAAPDYSLKPAPHQPAPPERNSKSSKLILIGLLILALVGAGIGGTWYLSDQADKQAKEEKKKEESARNEDAKRAQISRLREHIAEIRKKLEASDKVAKEKRGQLINKLEQAGQDLDQAAAISADQLKEIEKKCEDIGNDLREVEKDMESLQGLLPIYPLQSLNRDPVKC